MQFEIATLGESFEDLIFAHLPRLPNLSEELRTDAFVRLHGGGAIRTAVAASRLGAHCCVVSGLSNDAQQWLTGQRIAHMNLRQPHEHHAVTAALSTSTDRAFVTFNGVNSVLQERLKGEASKISANIVHFAFPPKNPAEWVGVVSSLKCRGITVSWDFGWDDGLAIRTGLSELLQTLDWVFFNEAEAQIYTHAINRDDALRACANLSTNVVVKLGSEGAVLFSRRRRLIAPAITVHSIDSTGAGDAFNGGFLRGLTLGVPPATCLHIANHVGALATTSVGGIDGLPQSLDQVMST